MQRVLPAGLAASFLGPECLEGAGVPLPPPGGQEKSRSYMNIASLGMIGSPGTHFDPLFNQPVDNYVLVYR